MTGRHPSARSPLRSFCRDESGAALVEFAMVLPMMLLVFAMIVESARVMIGFQSAIGAVRDATRYLARVVPSDICATGTPISTYSSQASAIANQNLGTFFLPSAITVTSVTVAEPACTTGFRVSPVPVVTVTAVVAIALPFAGLFTLSGATKTGTITATISDSARVFGS